MRKDFQEWHSLKSLIDLNEKQILYRSQEIWWCSLGANVGVEADGKHSLFERPVIVFRKFNREMFWGLPLTSQQKESQPFYFEFPLHGEPQVAVLSQMRTLSSKRLIRRVGKISDSKFIELNNAIIFFINKTDPLRGPQVPNGNKYVHDSSSK